MWTSILSLLAGLPSLVGKIIDFFSQGRSIELGGLREREAQASLERQDAEIAAQIDSRPVSHSKPDILAGLRGPKN